MLTGLPAAGSLSNAAFRLAVRRENGQPAAMGYSALYNLVWLVLGIPLLIVSAIVWSIGRRINFVGPGFAGFAVIALLGAATLQLWGSFDMLVLTPSAVQRERLGQQVAGPTQLVSFVHEPSMMDPASTWIYRLDGETVADLRSRCRGDVPSASACLVAYYRDDRAYTEIELQGDRLTIRDGLW